MTEYLVAVIGTDKAPNYFEQGWRLARAGVIGSLRDLLAAHGHINENLVNGQMVEEAHTADFLLDRWRGGPMRLCGYIARYDVFPLGNRVRPAMSDADLWRELDREARDQARERRVQDAEDEAARALGRLGIAADDPDYAAAWSLLIAGTSEGTLRRLADLALRPDVAPHLRGYRLPWQWSVATAETGDAFGTVERELLAEIAQRQASA